MRGNPGPGRWPLAAGRQACAQDIHQSNESARRWGRKAVADLFDRIARRQFGLHQFAQGVGESG